MSQGVEWAVEFRLSIETSFWLADLSDTSGFSFCSTIQEARKFFSKKDAEFFIERLFKVSPKMEKIRFHLHYIPIGVS